MTSLADYDDLLDLIHDAAAGRRTVGAMLVRVARLVDAVAAGFLVYDVDAVRVTHSCVAPHLAGTSDPHHGLPDMNDEPGTGALSRAYFRNARRFTDLVPRSRLDHATWFRRQASLAGVGYGIAIDLDLAGLRVRLFCMRPAGAQDFPSASLDLLDRIARHVARAFAPVRHRLTPGELRPDSVVIVYQATRIADVLRTGAISAGTLAERYGLTEAEARVALAADGRSRGEMAQGLGISINSLKTHLRRVHAKLGVRRSGELARIVAGLPDDPRSGTRE